MSNGGMIGVDVGGTFTDNVSVQDGKIQTRKVPTDQRHMESSVLTGAEALGVQSKSVFNHATTSGLNAVLTRKLPKVGYVTTMGHRDVLDMGRAWRPLESQTDASWHRSFSDAARPLVPRYLRRGVKERIANDGSVLIPLDEEQVREELEVFKRCEVQGVAICLINAYVNPEHELRLRQLVEEVLGDVACSISSEVSPLAKEFARATTTVVDAFMKNVLRTYSSNLIGGLEQLGFDKRLNFADCAATLTPVNFAMKQPVRNIFSGPAAGTMSSAYFGSFIDESNLLCCDVGGTSTDISVVTDSHPIVNTTFEVEHDLLLNTLANEIATLGAGGGSLVSVGLGGELQVGPESAGADPGPACYGRGGTQPTMTDACLMVGLLSEQDFLGGEMALDHEKAQRAFEELQTPLNFDERISHSYHLGLNHIGEGLVDISVKYGIDPRDYAIMAYGSAGPMLLPAVLDLVHAKSVIVPPYPGVFSALGLLSSELVYSDSRSAYMVLSKDTTAKINEMYESMEQDLLASISAGREEVQVLRTFDGRLVGQTWDTPFVNVPGGKLTDQNVETMIENFHKTYEERWGNRFDAIPVEGVTYRVQMTLPTDKVSYEALESRNGGQPEPAEQITLRYLSNGAVQAPVFRREQLHREDVVEGPAVIREDMATTQVCEGQVATVGEYGQLIITRATDS